MGGASPALSEIDSNFIHAAVRSSADTGYDPYALIEAVDFDTNWLD